MAVVLHSSQHADANDAIEAIETELGTNPSGASASVKDRLDTLVVGPGSASDNALARFDGTTGTVVQNSGITVDDNGKVTTDLTVSKATPSVVVDAASAAQEAVVDLQTGAVTRWKIGKNLAAESGSDAGSNFTIRAYSDAGVLLSTPLTILRASAGATFSGKVTTTHASGFEIGASGPRDMAGTGSPEGVVTAPVGSTWRDTNATTGAIKWIKASGTGNTGWKVEYGDTGRRSLAGVLLNSWTASSISLQRSGGMVTLWARTLVGTSASSALLYTLPVGFRPTADYVPFPIAVSGGTYAVGRGTVDTAGDVTVGGTLSDYTAARLLVSFPTGDAWPSSLPGSS